MKNIDGIWWPDNAVEHQRAHAMRMLSGLEWAIKHAPDRRTAVQAGGNVGLWPRRLAQSFRRVVTFEPDAVSRECLERNVPDAVEVHPHALGAKSGRCGLQHRSLGSHRVVAGDTILLMPLDALDLADVDLIAFDVEGYELPALKGARETVARSSPLIQVEVRGEEEKYGYVERDVHAFLAGLGYRQVSRQPGPDAVFAR